MPRSLNLSAPSTDQENAAIEIGDMEHVLVDLIPVEGLYIAACAGKRPSFPAGSQSGRKVVSSLMEACQAEKALCCGGELTPEAITAMLRFDKGVR